jgi:hypothetical protein
MGEAQYLFCQNSIIHGETIMTNETNTQAVDQSSEPRPGLRSLDRLVGTWHVSGPDIEGEVKYEWMEGGFFLLQRVDMVHSGRTIKGLEVIGYAQEFGATEPAEDITSRFYGNTGETLDYTYEVDSETLTIWGGQKGSPAYYKGQWSDDGSVNSGAWVWPGGGYDSTMTRKK